MNLEENNEILKELEYFINKDNVDVIITFLYVSDFDLSLEWNNKLTALFLFNGSYKNKIKIIIDYIKLKADLDKNDDRSLAIKKHDHYKNKVIHELMEVMIKHHDNKDLFLWFDINSKFQRQWLFIKSEGFDDEVAKYDFVYFNTVGLDFYDKKLYKKIFSISIINNLKEEWGVIKWGLERISWLDDESELQRKWFIRHIDNTFCSNDFNIFRFVFLDCYLNDRSMDEYLLYKLCFIFFIDEIYFLKSLKSLKELKELKELDYFDDLNCLDDSQHQERQAYVDSICNKMKSAWQTYKRRNNAEKNIYSYLKPNIRKKLEKFVKQEKISEDEAISLLLDFYQKNGGS